MSTSILIQITLYDESGFVKDQLVETYSGQYKYEVEKLFSQLGELVGKKIDPQYYVFKKKENL
jgi:hypothetical protein